MRKRTKEKEIKSRRRVRVSKSGRQKHKERGDKVNE